VDWLVYTAACKNERFCDIVIPTGLGANDCYTLIEHISRLCMQYFSCLWNNCCCLVAFLC